MRQAASATPLRKRWGLKASACHDWPSTEFRAAASRKKCSRNSASPPRTSSAPCAPSSRGYLLLPTYFLLSTFYLLLHHFSDHAISLVHHEQPVVGSHRHSQVG